MPLICNCRRVVSRGDGEAVEYRVVKSRKWDCPSCGLDRKRTMAEMCRVAGAVRIVTLTLEQPRVVWQGSPEAGHLPAAGQAVLRDGLLMPDWSNLELDSRFVPARHQDCDPVTHVAWNPRHGGFRWRVIPECARCLAHLSKMLERWVKRMRRAHPGFDYLHAREVHKSGAVHLHVAVVGIRRAVTGRSQAGQHIKRMWREVGGGMVDVGRPGDNTGADAGWYVGKYLAKEHTNTFARGYRRWSRSRAFAPEVRMTPPPRDPADDGGWYDPAAPLRLGGWVHPDGTEHRWRYTRHLAGVLGGVGAEGAGLDTSTANPPQSGGEAVMVRPSVLPDELRWGSRTWERV